MNLPEIKHNSGVLSDHEVNKILQADNRIRKIDKAMRIVKNSATFERLNNSKNKLLKSLWYSETDIIEFNKKSILKFDKSYVLYEFFKKLYQNDNFLFPTSETRWITKTQLKDIFTEEWICNANYFSGNYLEMLISAREYLKKENLTIVTQKWLGRTQLLYCYHTDFINEEIMKEHKFKLLWN